MVNEQANQPQPQQAALVEGTSGTLAEATRQWRSQLDQRSFEGVAVSVLRQAMIARRLSFMVRAQPPHDHVLVSSHILVARLRREIDESPQRSAVGAIRLQTTKDGRRPELSIDLLVQYGQVLREVSLTTRRIAVRVLDDLLGGASSSMGLVKTHVHVSEVTLGDPHLVDPAREEI